MISAGSWQALAGRFGLGAVLGSPHYVTRGAMGEIWRVDTTAGCWAVKWQFPWTQAETRPFDVEVQLAAAAAGIPLPRPVIAADGAAVVRIGGRLSRVYQWLDLGQHDGPPVAAATAAEAGRLLAMVHQLPLRCQGPVDPWYTEVPAAGYWTGLAVRGAVACAPWAAALSAARGQIAAVTQLVMPPSSRIPVICHRDFNPDNVLPAGPGGQLAVLDWENAGPLDPDRELGYVLFSWTTGSGQLDLAAGQSLLDAYLAAGAPAPELGHGLFTTAAACHVNLLSVMAEQWLSEPAHRSYAEEAVSGLLEHDLSDLLSFAAAVTGSGFPLRKGQES